MKNITLAANEYLIESARAQEIIQNDSAPALYSHTVATLSTDYTSGVKPNMYAWTIALSIMGLILSDRLC